MPAVQSAVLQAATGSYIPTPEPENRSKSRAECCVELENQSSLGGNPRFYDFLAHALVLTKETGIRLARIGGLLHPMSVVWVLVACSKFVHGIRVLNRRCWRKQYIEVSSAT